jgi:hypothetical protein
MFPQINTLKRSSQLCYQEVRPCENRVLMNGTSVHIDDSLGCSLTSCPCEDAVRTCSYMGPSFADALHFPEKETSVALKPRVSGRVFSTQTLGQDSF